MSCLLLILLISISMCSTISAIEHSTSPIPLMCHVCGCPDQLAGDVDEEGVEGPGDKTLGDYEECSGQCKGENHSNNMKIVIRNLQYGGNIITINWY